MTEEEIRQLAVDISESKVFGSWNIPNDDDLALPMCFMVLKFMSEKEMRNYLSDAFAIYEYLDKAGPRSINGRPTFFSCHKLTEQEFKKMQILVTELNKKKKEFLKT